MSEYDATQAESVRFMLDADPDPGLLSRLLIPFARRGLVPDRMWAHRGVASVHMEVALDEAPADAVALIEGNLLQIVGVRSVTLLRRRNMPRAA